MRSGRAGLLAAAGLLLVLTAPASAADPAAEPAGAQIYREGSSPSGGTIFARVGAGSVRLPGTAMPCAGCHGPDGQGRPEGGIAPPSITWETLTKPYGHHHADGRSHPPFSHASVAAAVEAGPGLRTLVEAALEQGFAPDLLVPGSLLRGRMPELPADYAGLLLIAYPTLPVDWRPERRQALAALARDARVPDTGLVSQILGYVAAQLVTEGLRRAGKGAPTSSGRSRTSIASTPA